MNIRLKLALILTAGITAATVAAGAVFVSLQYASLRAAQREKRSLLVQSVSRLESESLLARDPLMLLDYLQALRREHKEVLRCRALLNGRWEVVGEQEPSDAMVLMETALPDPPPASVTDLTVEIGFSRAAIRELQARALQSLLHDVGTAGGIMALLGLLISFPLSWTLTRRVVMIQKAIGQIGEGQLDAKVPGLGSDEIGKLAEGVNLMADKLKELDKLKKTFVASVTHELRSPLGAIDAYVKELLAAERLNAEDRASLERIRNNTRRLSHFVTNLLDMAKIERGKLDFAPRICDIGELIEDAAMFFQRTAADAGLALSFQVEPGLPQIQADPDLVTHVLTNFLSNALKFTRRGGRIQVDLRRSGGPSATPAAGGGDFMECSVIDSGVGIPKADIARVFAPFQRVANPMKATGVGLGLAISKSIIEMHGGSIGLQSEVGRGSRFYFRLPMTATRPVKGGPKQAPAATS